MVNYEKLLIDIGQILEQKLRTVNEEMRQGFDAVDQRFDAVDQEFVAVREEMRQGFDAVDQEFVAVREEMRQGFDAVDQEFILIKSDMEEVLGGLEISAEACKSYHDAIKPQQEKLKQSHDVLIGRVNFLEADNKEIKKHLAL